MAASFPRKQQKMVCFPATDPYPKLESHSGRDSQSRQQIRGGESPFCDIMGNTTVCSDTSAFQATLARAKIPFFSAWGKSRIYVWYTWEHFRKCHNPFRYCFSIFCTNVFKHSDIAHYIIRTHIWSTKIWQTVSLLAWSMIPQLWSFTFQQWDNSENVIVPLTVNITVFSIWRCSYANFC